MDKKKQLLCTFFNKVRCEEPSGLLKTIVSYYILTSEKIYEYEILNLRNQHIYIYNILGFRGVDEKKYLPDTISVHRKKETNTFYTINALNRLIVEVNNGVLDRDFKVTWENYPNMLLIVSNNELRRLTLQYKQSFPTISLN